MDAVLLESVDGRPHLAQVRPVIAAGLPVFVDKPVAGSLADAVAIYKLADENKVPLFSASSLRWYPGVVEVAGADVGKIHSAISYGPSPTEPHHPDLFWYGIHPTEALFTALGPECLEVSRRDSANTIVVTGSWNGDRLGIFHGIKSGKRAYQLTVFGEKGIAEQNQGGDYTPMLREIVRFFQSGKPPVSPRETLAIHAFMEAADESTRRGGGPVTLREVLEKAKCPEKWMPTAEATTR